jgi:tetratricopeptide (TPR) repeat protein
MGIGLIYIGKPKEAIDFINRAMRLDPHNPVIYLLRLGIAQLSIGNLEEAASLMEKAYRLNPEIWGVLVWLTSTYGLLGREEDARLALNTWKKEEGYERSLPTVMYSHPFKDRAFADRFAKGLIKAGVRAPSWGYFPAFKENQLNGEEIRRLLFGSKITGISLYDGLQWGEDRAKSGEFTWRGSGQISSDTGMSRIEGDMICTKFQKRLWGLEYCATVFRNPKGTYESKDEHFLCTDFGFTPFSLVK